MANISKTFGLDPEKIAHLLGIGCNMDDQVDEISADDEKAELLLNRLAKPALLDPSFLRLLPDIPRLLSNVMDLSGDNTIEELLLDKETEISLLKQVKDYNNKLSKKAVSKAEKDVVIAIYYAAIASALVFHDQRMTSFGYDDLEKSFKQLIDEPWMSSDLKDLFEKACNICLKASGKKE